MSEAPDYSQYTIDQLHDARRHVDVERYEDRANAIDAEIEARRRGHQRNVHASTSSASPQSSAQAPSMFVVVVWRVLSLPLLGFGAMFLMAWAMSWLVFLENLGVGLLAMLLFCGPAVAFLAGGLVLWEGYWKFVAGVLLVGVGLQVGLFGAFVGLLLTQRMEYFLPESFDNPTAWRMFLGSVFSGIVLATAGTIVFVIQMRRGRRARVEGGCAG